MGPNDEFLGKPKFFWASVRTLSQKIGYTVWGQNAIRVPTPREMGAAFRSLDLDASKLVDTNGDPTSFATELQRYFQHRADVLNNYVQPRLMDKDRAEAEFHRLRNELRPMCPLPMNKQKGEKKDFAFLTGIVNMLIEANADGMACNYDPRELTTVTLDGLPLRTLARRVDGAFPSAVNPTAVWEIKEYYYTTTFGSRVADGVYETLLDGMELEELHEHEGYEVKHYLMVDAKRTWWKDGKSYLCRMVDMVHMGYVDEVLFGYEVVERLPDLVREWVELARRNS